MLSKEDVLKIAKLSKLEFSENEIYHFQRSRKSRHPFSVWFPEYLFYMLQRNPQNDAEAHGSQHTLPAPALHLFLHPDRQ